ncbi:MAG: zinc transporter ZupT [Elusimicrobiaceae bacterium]
MFSSTSLKYAKLLPMESSVLNAFLVTLFAGLATAAGSVLAFFKKTSENKFFSAILGLSSGVMVYIALVDLLPKSAEMLQKAAPAEGKWYSLLAFFCGIALVAVIDRLIPEEENPHHSHSCETARTHSKLFRTGLFTAFVISIHNLPEGVAIFTTALKDPTTGISIALAVALHNIPVGISISLPIYYATKNVWKAFSPALLCGLTEPLGGLIGYFLLQPFMNETFFGVIFAVIAGILVFISFDELLPAAHENGEHHAAVYGLLCGMAVMAISLELF